MSPAVFDSARFRKLLLALPAKAIGYLYDFHYHDLVRMAFRLTRDSRASEDIVQETFVHVWENYKTLGREHEVSILAYIARVVKNKSITYYKRALGRSNSVYREYRGNHADQTIEGEIIRLETNREVRDMIVSFPRRERECLLMKLDEELSLEEMATRLNVSRKAIERSLTSANKRLRKYWGPRR